MRFALLLILAACSRGGNSGDRQLDFKQIHVTTDAKMRTDTVGGTGRFAVNATFVLVDAENTTAEGAYVTLKGSLGDPSGKQVGTLKAASLWIPAHESRTFALVDDHQQPHGEATGAQVEVVGAVITGFQPTAKLENVKIYEDDGKMIVEGVLVNVADRLGKIMVIGSFHDATGTPMTRPFDVLTLDPGERRGVQFVGPYKSVKAQLYLGDEAY